MGRNLQGVMSDIPISLSYILFVIHKINRHYLGNRVILQVNIKLLNTVVPKSTQKCPSLWLLPGPIYW